MHTIEEIEGLLHSNLHGCRSAYMKARDEFEKVTMLLPGIRASNREQKLIDAGANYSQAQGAYTRALHEYNRFLCNRTRPERFE